MDTKAIMEAVRNNPEKAQQAQQRFNEVLTRSATDMEFRKQLVSDPRAALSAHFGREIPETTNIRFIDAGSTPTVVLPDVAGSSELSDAELEAVAGGLAPLAYAGWIAVGFVAAAVGDALF